MNLKYRHLINWIQSGNAAKAGGVAGIFVFTPARVLVAGLLLLLALAFVPRDEHVHTADAGRGVETEKKRVKITTRREGNTTYFLVENQELAEVTVTFNLELTNLQASIELPFIATFPPQKTTEAFSVSPKEPNQPWDYSFTVYHMLGNHEAKHDDSFRYNLPYAANESYRVSQAYGGKFSHNGSNKYAIDWRMPEGTPVHAARGGLVVKTRDHSDRGGADISFDRYNNFIVIRHSDGTMAQYCHLQKGGIQVREGDIVEEGDFIALSGNTGFSTGPHLHFAVYKTRSGRQRESIPVKFKTAEGPSVTLKTGERHTALARFKDFQLQAHVGAESSDALTGSRLGR